jgi:hypothetical protein
MSVLIVVRRVTLLIVVKRLTRTLYGYTSNKRATLYATYFKIILTSELIGAMLVSSRQQETTSGQ